jgi:threonine/homoserine/homoserine lactone efflux protein
MLLSTISAFIGISLAVIIMPGPDTALTIRNSIEYGNRTGLATVAGIVVGQLCWASAASLSLQALFTASAQVFAVLKYCGAAYLFYLGACALHDALHPRVLGFEDKGAKRQVRRRGLAAFREGLVSNLTNPKMLVFFSSLLPPFVHHRDSMLLPQFLLLGMVFSALTFGWLGLYIFVISRTAAVVRRARVQRIIKSVTGLALMGFGLKIAVARDLR